MLCLIPERTPHLFAETPPHMNHKLNLLLVKLKDLEIELHSEIKKKEEQFHYTVLERKVTFTKAVADRHKQLTKKMSRYLREAKIFSIITAPVLWFCIVPILFMHLVAVIFQYVCFPVYGIPKVRRQDYIIMDRRKLSYLNGMEKFNCFYCEYVNGLLAYAQEIAGRTEQYWCPIKHAVRLKAMHSRYQYFVDYGDAEDYRKRIESVRRDFDDIRRADRPQPKTGPGQ
jgi:hypothetical protein